MSAKRYIYILVLIITFGACSSKPKEVLSMNEMTNLLVEMHTLDGIMVTGGFRHTSTEEKNKYYEAILEKYNIKQAEFDSSLIWYSRDPKRFEKIYVRVVDKLAANEAEVKAGKYHEILPDNSSTIAMMSEGLWKDSTNFTLKGSVRNQMRFAIADSSLLTDDRYMLRFTHRIAREDSCSNPHIHFNIHYANGQVDSIYLPTHHDGKLREYTLRLHADKMQKIDSLTGKLLACDSCADIAQNAYIDKLTLIRKWNSKTQDNLRTEIEAVEAMRTFPYKLVELPSEKFDVLFRKNQINPLDSTYWQQGK
ncbi:DUF4296 domain-containing protein [Paludibacter sp. 221]|uniref:DUF4296 domain-containing protein n=1 Tax=Paludibacter sp. 221 TaxID=2302939 RepID=UPI0013D36BA4|nr:DUF4296 domain-containing protein [Paludibacter sp. 221]NDV46058.1 DUF4296 domain-containing protein [Paludibacter sp. 221]